jgi:hypothetical protein
MIRAHAPELETLSANKTGAGFLERAYKFWIWPHLWSLDAVSVALLWQQTFADSFGATLLPAERLCLALAVWIIYTADRVLDAFKEQTLPTARHLFYMRYKQGALLGLAIAVCIGVLSCVDLEWPVLLFGTAACVLVALYMVSVHIRPFSKLLIPKELRVSALFALGTVLVPLVKTGVHVRSLSAVLLFVSLCFLNCASVEYREWQRYNSDRSAPVAAAWVTNHLQGIVVLIVVATCTVCPPTHFRELYGGIIISALGLLAFHRTQHRLSSNAMRVLVDIPLLLPVLFIVMRLYEL